MKTAPLAVCERLDMVGITHHSLDVFRKRLNDEEA
jgi:hypothetical protein